MYILIYIDVDMSAKRATSRVSGQQVAPDAQKTCTNLHMRQNKICKEGML